jgi:tRNA G18 (ribose-2'-O)-methylase SpoU
MALVRVTDPEDPRLQDYVSLTDVALRSRHEPESGIYIAESAEVIRRAVDAGHRPRSMLMQDTWVDRLGDLIDTADIDVLVGTREVLEQLTGFHVHRGALAAMHRPKLPSVDSVIATARRLVILEDLVDHTNVGAIFRSAAGLGMDAVLVTPRCADPLYRRSVRVSMGAVFAVPWTRIDPWPGSLVGLRDNGFTIAAVTPRSPRAIPLSEFSATIPDRVALILGAEGDGLTAPALSEADVAVSIPMHAGIDSLNVAAASAVVFWALATPRPDPRVRGS